MIPRRLAKKILESATRFPVVTVVGPRQSGKTTLVKHSFPTHRYLSLEDLDHREFARNDPRGFLSFALSQDYTGVIFDEVQHVPELLSYLQTDVDLQLVPGRYILTGSQNLLLSQHVSQTLAGRAAIYTLLPLSIDELKKANALEDNAAFEEIMLQGFYPSLYIKQQPENHQRVHHAHEWYSQYIRTYVERDVRQIKNITDLNAFQRFLKLCAGRIGQLLNFSSLASDCGLSVNTVKGWISLLEASYVIFLLHPYHQNFGKRVIKAPKLFFYDTGVACALLGIENQTQLFSHYLKGGLFEGMMIIDLLKQRLHSGLNPNLYFWRDHMGHELDCIIEHGEHITALEMKAGATLGDDAFDGLRKWSSIEKGRTAKSYLVYGGTLDQKRSVATVIGWQNISILNERV